MPSIQNWNEIVIDNNRLKSPNHNNRRPASTKPTHIVLHITGEDKFDSVKNTFMAKDSVSAHYLIDKEGGLFQFVADDQRSYHAGIDTNTRRLYSRGAFVWQRYLKYFGWYKSYPKDALFVDGDLNPVWDKSEAVFVARKDGNVWPDYDYFNTRWSNADVPINFVTDADPNNYSIGIELLGFGAKTADPKVYTDRMYEKLVLLLTNISQKHAIPLVKGRLIGHEDVNPIGRFGWDPAPGFNWSNVYK